MMKWRARGVGEGERILRAVKNVDARLGLQSFSFLIVQYPEELMFISVVMWNVAGRGIELMQFSFTFGASFVEC